MILDVCEQCTRSDGKLAHLCCVVPSAKAKWNNMYQLRVRPHLTCWAWIIGINPPGRHASIVVALKTFKLERCLLIPSGWKTHC